MVAVHSHTRVAGLLGGLSLLCVLLLPALASAADQPDDAEEAAEAVETPAGNQWHLYSSFGLRAIPIGTALNIDAGYRFALSDSDSLLFKDTYVEAGATVDTSPSYASGGGYIEALPLAVLKLRVQAQTTSYFGAFGYLYLPDDPENPDWELDSLGGAVGEGTSATGYQITGEATLQAKVGNIVAQVPATYTHLDVDVGQNYYDATLDMLLEPTDQFWTVRPLLGYVFVMEESDSWVLAGARWEHAASIQSDLSRDMPGALAVWKLPGDLAGGEMKLVGIGGYWLNHPNRSGTGYVASQFSVEWLY